MNEVLRQELISMRDDGPWWDDDPAVRARRDRNADRLLAIVARDGWPKSTDVGPDGAEAAWSIAMHALGRKDAMLQWAWDLTLAAQQGEALPQHVATLTDRTRVLRGKEQVYGTELDWDDEGQLSPLPITQPETADVRRESVRLEPLGQAVAQARAQAAADGRRPPADRAAWRRRVDALLRETGWRKG